MSLWSLTVGDLVTVIHVDEQPARATVVVVRKDPNKDVRSFDYRLENSDDTATWRTLMFDSEGWAWMRGHDAETAGALAAAWALRDREPFWSTIGTTTGQMKRQGR